MNKQRTNILALAVFPLRLNSRGLSIIRRLAFIAALALIGASSLSQTASAGFKELPGTHTPHDILSACQSSGGDFYNNVDGGGTSSISYGCHTSKGSVNCDEHGKCTGNCDNCSSDAPIKLKAGPVRVKNPPTTVSNPTNPPRRPVAPVTPVSVSNPNTGNNAPVILLRKNGSGGQGHGHK